MLGFVFYKGCKFLNRIDQTDLEYNTVYTNKYKENLFNTKLIGLNQEEIIKMFGEPFSKTKPGYFNAVLYTNYKDSVSFQPYSDALSLATISEKMKYRFISFDSLGDVDGVMIHLQKQTKTAREFQYQFPKILLNNRNQICKKPKLVC